MRSYRIVPSTLSYLNFDSILACILQLTIKINRNPISTAFFLFKQSQKLSLPLQPPFAQSFALAAFCIELWSTSCRPHSSVLAQICGETGWKPSYAFLKVSQGADVTQIFANFFGHQSSVTDIYRAGQGWVFYSLFYSQCWKIVNCVPCDSATLIISDITKTPWQQ